jgi:hypothetical protein
MAIFETGAVVGSISGDVGGASFVNSRGSKVVRKNRRPSPVNTEQQLQAQNRVAEYAHKWTTISAADKKAWQTYATNRPKSNRLGVSRQLSDYQSFMQYNLARQAVTTTPPDEPPINFTKQEMYNYTATSSVTSGIIVSFDTFDLLAGKSVIVYGRNLYRKTVPTQNNHWTTIGVFFTTATEFDITTEWNAILGTPQREQVIAIKIVPSIAPEYVAEPSVQIYAETTT